MRKCPRCASDVANNLKKCPKCGLAVAKMAEFEKFSGQTAFDDEKEKRNVEVKFEEKDFQDNLNDTQSYESQLSEKKKKKKEKKIKPKKVSDTDFESMATNAPKKEEEFETYDSLVSRKKLERKKKELPVFRLDVDGKIDIDTSDVEIVGEKNASLIREQYDKSYSVKKARGEFEPERIRWWEIYKVADRYFARKKIKKEVSKASRIKPSFVSKTKLLLLSIFLGWMGAHNFYAGNKKKGWFSAVCSILFFSFIIALDYVPFLYSIWSVGALFGVCSFGIWVFDTINIISNKFKYAVQKEAFIEKMNLKTRSKLGNKYIDLELYHQPWPVRFKAWCKVKKRNFEEDRYEARQNKIQRQKAKLENQRKMIKKYEEETEKEKINEQKSEDVQNDRKIVIDEKILKEVDTFNNSENEKTETKQNSKPKQNNKYSKMYKNKKKK